MRIQSRSGFVLLAGLCMALLAWLHSAAVAADPVFSRVSFPTCDGVELAGTFYPASDSKKDAVVMLLHDFEPRKGGGSHGDWDKLAASLQKEGYAVLSFDFRGFGQSKSIRDEFWRFRHNQQGIPRGYKNGVKSAESIDQKDFQISYYPFLVNDIVAAKAFLDRKNDAREINSSNLLLVGAGDGATLGALWAAAEMHRQRDTSPPMLIPPAVPLRMDDPEGKDIAGAVWLTISPNIAGRSVSKALSSALVEVARDNKVPVAFFYGKNDSNASNLTLNYLNTIQPKKYDLKNTGEKAIPGTELAGSKLLGERVATKEVIKQLDRVIEDRGSKEWKKREEEKSRYFWTMGKGRTQLAKMPGEKVAHPIPPWLIRLGN
jgi:alpha-beta hydrolase superfamily lysophospholipase